MLGAEDWRRGPTVPFETHLLSQLEAICLTILDHCHLLALQIHCKPILIMEYPLAARLGLQALLYHYLGTLVEHIYPRTADTRETGSSQLVSQFPNSDA